MRGSFMYTIAEFVSGMFAVVGIAAVVVGMIFLYRKVIPAKLDGTFGNKWMQRLHDYFNFKKLYIEAVLKVIFTVLTITFVVFGVVGVLTAFSDLLFNMIDSAMNGYFAVAFGRYMSSFFVSLLESLALIVVGPVVTRLIYEGTMMLILMVKNVMDINNKIKAPKEDAEEETLKF